MRDENELPDLVVVGSCGLHAIHGAFETGVKTTGWQLENVCMQCENCFIKRPPGVMFIFI